MNSTGLIRSRSETEDSGASSRVGDRGALLVRVAVGVGARGGGGRMGCGVGSGAKPPSAGKDGGGVSTAGAGVSTSGGSGVSVGKTTGVSVGGATDGVAAAGKGVSVGSDPAGSVGVQVGVGSGELGVPCWLTGAACARDKGAAITISNRQAARRKTRDWVLLT